MLEILSSFPQILQLPSLISNEVPHFEWFIHFTEHTTLSVQKTYCYWIGILWSSEIVPSCQYISLKVFACFSSHKPLKITVRENQNNS